MCEKFFIEISLMLFSTSGRAIALKKATHTKLYKYAQR